MRKFVGAALAAVALGVSPVQAACWNQQEVAAGTVRDFQSMLMVAALRCQVMHFDMTGDYNTFLQANKATIQKLNERLKAHFIKANGAVGGQKAYDSFATSLANAYGAHGSSAEVCTSMAALAREAALMAGSEEGLLLLAQRQGIATRLPEGACDQVARSSVAMATEPAQGAVAAAMAGPAADVVAVATAATRRSGPDE